MVSEHFIMKNNVMVMSLGAFLPSEPKLLCKSNSSEMPICWCGFQQPSRCVACQNNVISN